MKSLLPTAAAVLGLILSPAIISAKSTQPARAVPDLAMKLVWIEPGSFTMGTPADEQARRENESPQTKVTLSRGFWLAELEVTHGQWKKLMGTTVVDQARLTQRDDTLFLIGGRRMIPLRDYFSLAKDGDTMQLVGNTDDDIAMIWVSWDDAMAFCAKLNAQAKAAGTLPAGYEYRLPTEAEWEYACRAGTTTATSAGPMVIKADQTADVLDAIAWYAGNGKNGYKGHAIDTGTWATVKEAGAGKSGPRPVGTKAPNPWGLYDMHGNVAEWCMDWDGPLPGGNVTDWQGPSTGRAKIRRGGGWSTFAANARSGYRNAHETNFHWINLGFRVALAPKLP